MRVTHAGPVVARANDDVLRSAHDLELDLPHTRSTRARAHTHTTDSALRREQRRTASKEGLRRDVCVALTSKKVPSEVGCTASIASMS